VLGAERQVFLRDRDVLGQGEDGGVEHVVLEEVRLAPGATCEFSG
jgi:hypothetical protein